MSSRCCALIRVNPADRTGGTVLNAAAFPLVERGEKESDRC
jgi:hypothetical protein